MPDSYAVKELIEEKKDFEAQFMRILEATGATTDADLARILGIQPPSITGAKKRRSIPKAWLEKVSAMFKISIDWLLYGDSRYETSLEQLKSKQPSKKVSIEKRIVEQVPVLSDGIDVDMMFIPLVEARLSAGTGSLETSPDSDRKYAFRSDFLHRKGNPGQMVLMRVSGNSMEPEIKDGDVVLLDQGKKHILPGRMYAVGIEDAIYIKQIDTMPGKLVLKSMNPAFPPVEVDMRGDLAEQARILGQILWVGREYR
ncbi:S24 family peptidase [uncultured Desulfovibrio sp.]|uniref:LexA family transcriptional regulator n=1 Tax=uncultured Desulfovibrio sp. TaxID=167968 RepID=UPI0026719AFF|nr:S24 family peptidase [uncultured Desulfovibrio sp.]